MALIRTVQVGFGVTAPSISERIFYIGLHDSMVTEGKVVGQALSYLKGDDERIPSIEDIYVSTFFVGTLSWDHKDCGMPHISFINPDEAKRINEYTDVPSNRFYVKEWFASQERFRPEQVSGLISEVDSMISRWIEETGLSRPELDRIIELGMTLDDIRAMTESDIDVDLYLSAVKS